MTAKQLIVRFGSLQQQNDYRYCFHVPWLLSALVIINLFGISRSSSDVGILDKQFILEFYYAFDKGDPVILVTNLIIVGLSGSGILCADYGFY